jgi:adenylate cyclase
MQNHRSASQLAAHVPLDRLYALLGAPDLPPEADGSVLFADLAGFTPLTERLLRTFGARRGAEELTQLLDLVYERLIASVQRHGGSVIGFSGDAITCWFSGDDARPALACGLAMQQAMASFAAYQLAPDQLVALTLKVALASGRVQRFVVGDPTVQLIDILAGEPLGRLAALEPLVRSGEVIVDRLMAARLHASLTVQEWRADASGEQGAIVTAVRTAAPLDVHAPALPPDLPAGIEQWVAPGVLARLHDQQQPFLTELRPTIAVFVSFSGASEYDLPAQAELDRYIRWVQQILLRYEATLIQVSIGEKGNYLYASFGAPLAHEDDSIRAVRAAIELRDSPHAVRTERIGIAEGIARSGVYGSTSRRTYGVLGDAVNLAARLMQAASPGQILASDQVWSATGDHVQWDILPPLTVKGKQTPLLVASLGGSRATPSQPALGALVGRTAELEAMRARLELARHGAGQVAGWPGRPSRMRPPARTWAGPRSGRRSSGWRRPSRWPSTSSGSRRPWDGWPRASWPSCPCWPACST